MDGFVSLITELLLNAGTPKSSIFTRKRDLVLPGYFRPTKQWDLLVVENDQLIAAIEAKSHAGPSFGNNFNNRTEEAMGTAVDLWTAFREGKFNRTIKPWVGYILLLEDCPASQKELNCAEPHFEVFEEFKKASYAKRYELFCRRLVRERHYSAACLLLSDLEGGSRGEYSEPANDLEFGFFAKALRAQAETFRAD